MITVIYLPSPSEIFVNEQGHRLVVFKATTAWCSEFSEKQENPTGTHTITRVLKKQVLMSQNRRENLSDTAVHNFQDLVDAFPSMFRDCYLDIPNLVMTHIAMV